VQEHLLQLDNVKIWAILQGKGLPVMLCNGGPGCYDYLVLVSDMINDTLLLLMVLVL